MLSSSNTLTDMKLELEAYDYYGYASDDAFNTVLTAAVAEVKRLTMVPRLGSGTYDTIEALDKTGLSDAQENVYYAEINYSIAAFMRFLARKDKGRTPMTADKKGPSVIPYEAVSFDYMMRGNKCMVLAGYEAGHCVDRFGIYERSEYDPAKILTGN